MPESLIIISGGQTGADRAALDAAMEAGVATGGWCPAGRAAADGAIPDRYAVRELPGAGYDERTLRNVMDSDATLIVSFGPPIGGTAFTLRCCHAQAKHYALIDAQTTPISIAAKIAAEFISAHRVQTLNVAGPRASEQPGIYNYVHQVINQMLLLRSDCE